MVALFAIGGVKLAGVGLYALAGGEVPGPLFGAPGDGWVVMILGQIYVMFAEEIGWRGFALPRLQAKYGPLGATLVLALIHGAWHLPMFIVPGSNQYGSSFLVYLWVMLSWSMVWTLLHNRTGSLFAAMLFHGALNAWAFTSHAPAAATPYIWLMHGVLSLACLIALPRPWFTPRSNRDQPLASEL